MPMIDVYAESGTFPSESLRTLGLDLTHASLRAEGVPTPHHKQGIGLVAERLLNLIRRLNTSFNSFQAIFAVSRNNLGVRRHRMLPMSSTTGRRRPSTITSPRT
jgi:hypothetical protein